MREVFEIGAILLIGLAIGRLADTTDTTSGTGNFASIVTTRTAPDLGGF